jgi:hypothetical protein
MNSWERQMFETLVRAIRRQAEKDLLHWLKMTRRELVALSQEQTSTECGQDDYAQLEELSE